MMHASYRMLAIAAGLFFVGLWAGRDLLANEIHDAVRLNDLKAVEKLLAKSPKLVNSLATEQGTPLHVAASHGDVDMVRLLIAHGADVKATFGFNNFTPLHCAYDADIARVLLENGSDLRAKSSFGAPLQAAISSNNVEMIDVFVKAGAELTFKQHVELGHVDEVAKRLKSEPWLAKAPRKCLHVAASGGHLEIARLLLDHGADLNQDFGFSNVSGVYSPLSAAVTSGHYEVAELLCKRGAETNVSGGKNYDNLFAEALVQNDLRIIQLMLEHGADVQTQDVRDIYYRSCTPLHAAAERGNRELCQLLVRYKANVNARTSKDATPLDYAADNHQWKVCDFLLDNGAQLSLYAACALGKPNEVEQFLEATPGTVNKRDKRLRRTPLFWASAAGRREVVELLIRRGADVNAGAPSDRHLDEDLEGSESAPAKKDVGKTPLHAAAHGDHAAVIELLLENGAKIDALDDDRITPLFLAMISGKRNAAKLLLEKGAEVEPEGGISVAPCAFDTIELMELILARHPSQSSIDQALQSAVEEHVKVAELLLAHGAKANIYTACTIGLNERVAELLAADPSLANKAESGYRGERPLALAAKHGHLKTVELLLAKGAGIEPKKGTPPLQEAAGGGHLEVMSLFVTRGANIDHKDDYGVTALHTAASGNHLPAVEWLIEHGADVQARDTSRRTALHAAARAGAVEVARKLLESGLPVDCQDDFRATPLHEAARVGHTEMANLLLDAGAKVNAKNRRGETPLFYVERELDPSRRELGLEPNLNPVAALLRAHGGVK